MNFPRLTEIEEALDAQADSHTEFSVAVLRNITVEGMEPYLRYAAMQDRLRLQLAWGDYDNILQEANGMGSGVVTDQTQAVLVCLWLPAFSEVLGFGFAAASREQVEEELGRVRAYCCETLVALRKRTNAPILWLAFEPPAWPAYGIMDATSKTGQREAIAGLNATLAEELGWAGNARLVDSAQVLERIGAREFYDWRYWHMAHAPYARGAMAELAGEIQKHIRAASGRVRKCLVLDCDNTLWGGVVGEDGLDGIRIGVEHPGSAYREFQREVLNLYHRGVIIALCSKNNLDDVLDVLRNRSDMLLREEHIASMRVNWQDKATNLREIAAELNIGLDSMVFADDSDFEVNLVRSELPEVQTLHMSTARPYENRQILLQAGCFDTHALTEEDRSRGQMYRAEVARKSLQTSITDMGEYLRSLEMRLQVAPLTPTDLERAAQLCQRTNQFNLTTRRHSSHDLAAQMENAQSTLMTLRLQDRFGDYGMIGFCMVKGAGEAAEVDTFLMSCRALGRGVETAFLAMSLQAAAAKGARQFSASYLPTKKNAQVADFYERHGFTALDTGADGTHYRLQWEDGRLTVPEHFIIA